MSWVPPGKVIAKVTSFLLLRLLTASLTPSVTPYFTLPLKSLESVIACPLLFRVMATYISLPA
jgi:hypothetical protein